MRELLSASKHTGMFYDNNVVAALIIHSLNYASHCYPKWVTNT